MKTLTPILYLLVAMILILMVLGTLSNDTTTKIYILYATFACGAGVFMGGLLVKEGRERLKKYFLYWFPPFIVLILMAVYLYHRAIQ